MNIFLHESVKKYTIYLDLDGVLTDFDKAVRELGYGNIEEAESKYGKDFIWKLIAKKGVSFWSDMEWMQDGKELWDYVKQYHPIILSAPISARSSRVGKKIWVDKNLGTNVKLILEPSKSKKKYANDNSILIDDREDNILGWKQNNGIGILHKNTKETIQQLQEIL